MRFNLILAVHNDLNLSQAVFSSEIELIKLAIRNVAQYAASQVSYSLIRKRVELFVVLIIVKCLDQLFYQIRFISGYD